MNIHLRQKTEAHVELRDAEDLQFDSRTNSESNIGGQLSRQLDDRMLHILESVNCFYILYIESKSAFAITDKTVQINVSM